MSDVRLRRLLITTSALLTPWVLVGMLPWLMALLDTSLPGWTSPVVMVWYLSFAWGPVVTVCSLLVVLGWMARFRAPRTSYWLAGASFLIQLVMWAAVFVVVLVLTVSALAT